jgi:hypothetical protein
MPTQIKSNSNIVRYVLGGFAGLAVGFAFGRAINWLEDPITPPKPVMTASGITEQPGVNVGGDSRVGGVFSTDGSGGGRSVPTVGEITGGKPLEDWLKRVMAQEDELFRMQNFMKLLESLNSPADIEAALKVVMSGGGRGRGGFGGARFTEISMLMSKYVQLDPKGAMAYSTKLEGGEKFMATSSALRTWTRLSPDAALAWAASEGAAVSMDFGRGPGGPGGGGDQEDGQPKTNFALMSVVSQLAKTDIDKALSTGATMELGRFGDRMVETLASEMFNQKGADAMRSYADSLQPGAFRDQFVQQTAERLAEKDPSGTAQWVAKMETGDTKRRALGRVVDSWAKTDLAAASSYVASQPVGPDMDSARSEIINRLSKDDPKQAWNMITSITDAERQARTARQVGPALVKADPQNGPAIIAATPLPEEVKQQAVAPQREGGPGGGFGGFGGRGGGRPGGGGGR